MSNSISSPVFQKPTLKNQIQTKRNKGGQQVLELSAIAKKEANSTEFKNMQFWAQINTRKTESNGRDNKKKIATMYLKSPWKEK